MRRRAGDTRTRHTKEREEREREGQGKEITRERKFPTGIGKKKTYFKWDTKYMVPVRAYHSWRNSIRNRHATPFLH